MLSPPLEAPTPLDYRATIVLLVAAGGLSVKSFLGFDLGMLVLDHRAWPDEPWRLFTGCLLHAGWFHLIFNLMWTQRFGSILEPIFGTFQMVVLFLVLGIVPMGAQWTISGPAVGLSGIGYGLFGVLFALDRYAPGYRGVMNHQTAELFGLWFLFCVVATFMDWMPVANTAHGVGFVAGFVVGWGQSAGTRRQSAGIAWVAALALAAGAGAFWLRPYVNHSRARAWELSYDATLALEAGDDQRALELLMRSVELDPERITPWHNLGVAHQRLGQYEEARQAFAREEELKARAETEPEERSPFDFGDEAGGPGNMGP